MGGWPWTSSIVQQDDKPLVVSERTVRAAVEAALMYTYTTENLRIALTDEFRLAARDELPRPGEVTKRDLIRFVTADWSLA